MTRSAATSPVLHAHLLGVVDLASALALNGQLADEIAERNDGTGCVLLAEHRRCLTIGREATLAQLPQSIEQLTHRGVDVFSLNRGGGLWTFGEGVLHVLLAIPTARLGLQPAQVRSALASALAQMVRELAIPCEATASPAGVAGRLGQLGAIGVSMIEGVVRHGLYVPMTSDPKLRELMDPAVRWSNLSAHRGRPLSAATVRESILRNLARTLGYTRWNVMTGHPRLVRMQRTVHAQAVSTANYR